MKLSHDDMLEVIQRLHSSKAAPQRLIDGTLATHEAIAADVEAFLARGGRIEQAVSVQTDIKASSTDRRWVQTERDNERGRRRAHALRRQTLVLPGSASVRMPADIQRTRTAAQLRGDRFYFTGKACHRGHMAPRYVSSKMCVERERMARFEQRAA